MGQMNDDMGKDDDLLVVVEVTVVDDGGVKTLRVGHDDVVDLLRDHAGRLAILWVDFKKVST